MLKEIQSGDVALGLTKNQTHDQYLPSIVELMKLRPRGNPVKKI